MTILIKALSIAIFSLFFIFQTVSAEETTLPETAVGIGQLMNNTDLYPDSITVQGIVSKVFPQDNLIALIDTPNESAANINCNRGTPYIFIGV